MQEARHHRPTLMHIGLVAADAWTSYPRCRWQSAVQAVRSQVTGASARDDAVHRSRWLVRPAPQAAFPTQRTFWTGTTASDRERRRPYRASSRRRTGSERTSLDPLSTTMACPDCAHSHGRRHMIGDRHHTLRRGGIGGSPPPWGGGSTGVATAAASPAAATDAGSSVTVTATAETTVLEGASTLSVARKPA